MHKINKFFVVQISLILGIFCQQAFAIKTVVSFNEDERISIKISNKSMNRVCIDGDRIQQVIGLNDQVTIEKDEHNGGLFLKVPEGNQEKLEITLITEGGLTQDLTLVPVEKSATTIVLQASEEDSVKASHASLKKHPPKSHNFQSADSMAPTILQSNTPYQDTLINLMKVLFLGAFEPESLSSCSRPALSSVSITFHQGFQQEHFVGLIYEISNPSEGSINLQERDFYQLGDLALALDRKILEKGQKTNLYVIRKDA